MLQAEIGGGGRVDQGKGLQKPGFLIRDFVLMSAEGGRVQVSDVTDRFGEICSVYDVCSGQNRPRTDEILRMLEFINHQCPECEPSEWPR